MHQPSVLALTVSILVHLSQGQSPDISVTLVGGTDQVQQESYLSEGTNIVISCNHVLPSGTTVLEIFTRDADGAAGVTLGRCLYFEQQPPKVVEGTPATPVCQNTDITLTYTLRQTVPYSFYCMNKNLFNDAITRTSTDFRSPKTYVAPTAITSSVNLAVGQDAVFTCRSTARPPPVLSLFVGNSSNTPTSGDLTHEPPTDTISDSSPAATSTITWRVAASEIITDLPVYCSLSHVSGDQQPSRVTDGPNNGATQTENFRVDGSVSEALLTCDLSSYPSPTYAWYNGSISSGTVISTNERLSINFLDYQHLTASNPLTSTYVCEATNPISNKTASQSFRVVLNSERMPEQPGTTAGVIVQAGLTWWAWLLIALGIILIIGAAIAIIVVCKRRASSAPEKKKLAKAGKSNTMAMGSSGSLQRQQSDIIRTRSPGDQPSSPKPSSPVHNQYTASVDPSSPSDGPGYAPKIEDYADALDFEPGSRRPIAFDNLGQLDAGSDQGEPPAYNGYENYSRNSTYNPHEPRAAQPYDQHAEQPYDQHSEQPYNSRDPQHYTAQRDPYQRDSYNPRTSYNPYNSYNRNNSGEESFNMGYGAPC